MLGGTLAAVLNRFLLLPDANLPMPDGEAPVRDAVVFLYVDHEASTTAGLVKKFHGDRVCHTRQQSGRACALRLIW